MKPGFKGCRKNSKELKILYRDYEDVCFAKHHNSFLLNFGFLCVPAASMSDHLLPILLEVKFHLRFQLVLCEDQLSEVQFGFCKQQSQLLLHLLLWLPDVYVITIFCTTSFGFKPCPEYSISFHSTNIIELVINIYDTLQWEQNSSHCSKIKRLNHEFRA